MPTPRDPDTEDKRNDRDLEEESPEERERDEEDDAVSSEVRYNLFDEDEDMIDFDLDDLREMEGPDA
jgi:hypothetical protein